MARFQFLFGARIALGEMEVSMLPAKRYLGALVMAFGLALPLVTAGCAARVGVGYRVYDPYGRDYHRWNGNESIYYNQWAVETHRDPHRDFRRLNRGEQRQYWQWRHNDHDRDRR
jgi:hypothetical protein